MASAASTPFSSTKETTNYARLCRLLVDVGTQALRDTFDKVHPPAGLHGVLARPLEHSTLQSLRKKRILNASLWGKLYPAIHSSVSSANFDITLLVLLLRNICGLTPPTTGWDSLPAAADRSVEANIARIKYFRNNIYGHASQASVDDPTFTVLWQDISNALLGLGGASYGAAITNLKTCSMDPDDEKHYQNLLKEWKQDEDNIKEKLDKIEDTIRAGLQEIKGEIGNLSEKLETLKTPVTENEDLSECDTASKSKKARLSAEDSATAFLKWSQNQLCSFYNSTMSQVMITPWDPGNTMDLDEVYVELSLLRDDRKLDKTMKEEFKDYGEIFVGHGRHLTPKRILVYGKPGIGKSTFSKKLAVDWARGEKEALKKFTVLLLVRLRDVCNTPNLRDLLERSELLSADDPVVFNQLYDYILKNQEKVLLVLDGYDEYSAEKPSPVHQIWKGSQLRDCAILVTTRPWKNDELRISSHVQFEISGFDHEQVMQFVRKFLSHQTDTIDAFTDFLTKRKLWDVAKIPLLLLMLCLTWKEKDRRGLPKSRTDVYERFFQTLFDHLAAKASEEPFTSIDEHKDDLSKLGRLAFDALMIDCLYFELSKVPEDIRLLIKKFLAVGFFQLLKLSSSPRPEEIVHFLHKTVQEFLSAWFIVQELTNPKKGHLTCLLKVDTFKKIKKMHEVLKFVCELSSQAACAVLGHLQMIGEKESLTEYSFTENPSVENDLSTDQREFHLISLDCFLSCPASDRQAIYPLFLQCVNSVVVIRCLDQLRIVAKENVLRICSSPKPNYIFLDERSVSSEKDVSSIMCDLEFVFVTCYGETKPVNMYIDLFFRCFVKKEGEKMVCYVTFIGFLPPLLRLLSELVSAPQSDVPPSRQPIDQMFQNQDASKSLCLTEETSSSDQSLKHSLSFVRGVAFVLLTNEELTIVNKVLAFVNRLQDMEIKLYPRHLLEKCFDVQLIESLVSRIYPTFFTNSLRSLTLDGFHLAEMFVVRIVSSLHQVPNLQKLNLSWNCLSYIGLKTLTENLYHVKHLTELTLCGVEIGHLECQLLATALKHVSSLNVLNLSSNPLARGITELSKHLNSVPHLTELNLSQTNMGEEEVTAVACALKYVPELRYLDLSFNPLGRRVNELTKHLSSAPHHWLTLGLSSVRMTYKEAQELCTASRQTWFGLITDYHTIADFTNPCQLRTEAELKERGVAYDDEE